jgi:hypothetical protein
LKDPARDRKPGWDLSGQYKINQGDITFILLKFKQLFPILRPGLGIRSGSFGKISRMKKMGFRPDNIYGKIKIMIRP